MTARVCPVCTSHQLPPGRTVCTPCVGRLRNRLIDLPDLMTDLDLALTRQTRFTRRVGGKSAETPLPVNLRAADAAYTARTTLLLWADRIAEAHNDPTPDTWATIGRYLHTRAEWAAAHPAGPEAFTAILDALHAAVRAIDRPRYRRVPVHVPCVEHATALDVGARTPCPGSYYVLLDNADTSQSLPDMICDQDPTHRITPEQWQRGQRRGALDSPAARRFLATLRTTG